MQNTYLWYRKLLRLQQNHGCNWEWGYGNVPDPQYPTAAAWSVGWEKMNKKKKQKKKTHTKNKKEIMFFKGGRKEVKQRLMQKVAGMWGMKTQNFPFPKESNIKMYLKTHDLKMAMANSSQNQKYSFLPPPPPPPSL